MEKRYTKIAEKLRVPPQAIHLVHYVLTNMKSSCVFPPDVEAGEGKFYTPLNICSAILSYLRHQYSDDPWRKIVTYGIQSSEDVAQIVDAIQADRRARVVRNLDVDLTAYAELFKASPPTGNLRNVRWIAATADDVFPRYESTEQLLQRHFIGVSLRSLVISKRRFPEHVRADLQMALEEVLRTDKYQKLYGLTSIREEIDFRTLAESEDRLGAKIAPLTYSEINIGNRKTIRVLSNGLWLSMHSGRPFAVVLGQPPRYGGSDGVQIEVASLDDDDSRQFATAFFDNLEHRVEASTCYRGKILSFEQSDRYRGHTAGIKVHELNAISRNEVILPQETVDLLDRNVIDFVRQRPELKKRGMNLKKGLLLFGPPGTGKTHTVHYLSRALPETTTLIITSEQIGLLSHYMNLARLLQPSLVVVEDADLIARQREQMDTCEEVLLNKLLNEMDGLKADAEIIFILTTNRPETLEVALTARPGRIDQAIEFPLPDDDGRLRLANLYAGTQKIDSNVLDTIVNKTGGTSAAFIKELMRRATQYSITRAVNESISCKDVEQAVEEMLFNGGAFNRKILGAAGAESQR